MTERVLNLLDELDFDPLYELVALYRDPETDKRTKVRIASELAQFVAPKLKAIDVQEATSAGITINLVQYGHEKRAIEIDDQSPESFRLRHASLITEE